MLSGGSVVAMVQACEARPSENAPTTDGSDSTGGRALAQPDVRSVVVMVSDVLGHKSLQMPLVYRNNLVEEFAPATSNPPLGHAVLPRTLNRGSYGCDVHRANRNRHLQSIFCVVVEDQELGCGGIRKGFTQLLNDPGARRMPRDVEVQDAPTIMADDEKAIEHAEGQRRDGEEIHRRDRFAVITQKSCPALSRIRHCWGSPHPA